MLRMTVVVTPISSSLPVIILPSSAAIIIMTIPVVSFHSVTFAFFSLPAPIYSIVLGKSGKFTVIFYTISSTM